jgi:hypothetical protein
MKKRIFLALLARKNKQIKLEREKCRALEETNKILSAYVGLLVAKCGGVKIPKSLIAEAIGGFHLSVGQSDGCYTVTVTYDRDEAATLVKEKIESLEL